MSSALTGRLGQAHVQVASRDLDGVGEQGRGRVRRRVVSAVIGRRSRRGRRVRSRFRLLGGGDAVAHLEHGGEADVLPDGDVRGVGDGHDSVGEGVGAQDDAHVHGVGLAHAKVLLLRVHAARSEGTLHGAPGAEVVLGFEEFDLVGGAQSRVCRAHGGRVLVGRTGNEVVGDVDAARGDGQVVGVPHGRRIRVGGAEDRVAYHQPSLARCPSESTGRAGRSSVPRRSRRGCRSPGPRLRRRPAARRRSRGRLRRRPRSGSSR